MVARFQSAPKETHAQIVKRISRYLKGTMDFGLWYPRGDSFNFIAYSDVDWDGCVDNRKSTSVVPSFLEVSWFHGSTKNC